MKVVYEAENLIDAHLVKGMLEQQGIAVYVRGEYLTGAIGGLPVGGLVALCVDEDAEPAARELLAQIQRERNADADAGADARGGADDGDFEAVSVPV